MSKVKEALISENDIRIAARILRAINHKRRLEILYMLQLHKKLTVTDIYETLQIEQSVASQHLAILRVAGVLDNERSGKNKYYFINHRRLQEINVFSKALVATNIL